MSTGGANITDQRESGLRAKAISGGPPHFRRRSADRLAYHHYRDRRGLARNGNCTILDQLDILSSDLLIHLALSYGLAACKR